MSTKWVLRRLSVDEISYGHSPDKRGERKDKWGKAPIVVEPKSRGGYRVCDGNDRLYYALRRGDTYIDAYVPAEVVDSKPVKKCGFFYWE